MVFSFLKKLPGKKPRQAATPAVEARSPDQKQKKAAPSDAPTADKDPVQDDITPDFSDFVLSEALPGFQVDGDDAPEDAEAEEAAIFFANGQDAAAQTVLEGAVNGHGARAERPWLMLFDLYRLTGQQAAFESLEIEYAQAFERSPLSWGQTVTYKAAPTAGRPKGVTSGGGLAFKGELLGSNVAIFEAIQQTLARNGKLRLDMSKIKQCDLEGCAKLLDLLVQAGKKKYDIELVGREILGELLLSQIEPGRAEGKEYWLLLIELCQMQGQQDVFEEIAIDYAVTFEESPPSWIPGKVIALKPETIASKAVKQEDEEESDKKDEAYVLRGEVKSSRFADLSGYAESHDYVMIDCAELVRMDFVSAGALLNVLSTVRRSGKPIAFHHLNYLVVELFGIVGLKEIATIVFAKR